MGALLCRIPPPTTPLRQFFCYTQLRICMNKVNRICYKHQHTSFFCIQNFKICCLHYADDLFFHPEAKCKVYGNNYGCTVPGIYIVHCKNSSGSSLADPPLEGCLCWVEMRSEQFEGLEIGSYSMRFQFQPFRIWKPNARMQILI